MKWKLNIRREVTVVAVVLGVSFLIAFSERKQDGLICKDIIIELDNVHENHFLDEADVLRMLEGTQSVKGMAFDRMNLRTIESKLKQDRHISEAELYSDLKGNLVVNIELRRPVARIIQPDAPDAYIAEDGVVMPVSDKYTSRVVLISGPYSKRLVEMGDLRKHPEGEKLLTMIRFINKNKFWRAQVAQLDINSLGKVTLLPQVTGQRVEFGKAEDIEHKFSKLMIFYKEILPQRGWTRYDRVNLEYEDQIIAE
ncbi:MAG: cell division protein FtsQ [Cyclobacteriaceae bacterium]|nr:cell division protein FtsQ [Cyclobacteriaceae bacterium]